MPKYEIYMPIKGYENYEVSNLGNIKNVKNNKLLKPFDRGHGYLGVRLYKNGKCKNFSVHRLVISTFKANPDNKSQVNHKDEDKTNNNLNNLEWCTGEYNANYGTHIERVEKTKKENGFYERLSNINKERLSIKVINISTGIVYDSAHDAARQLNLNNSCITRCCKNKAKSHGGFKWSYYIEGDSNE